ncbi:unnamed protein product, partial [Mesorhabditis spiculigera]
MNGVTKAALIFDEGPPGLIDLASSLIERFRDAAVRHSRHDRCGFNGRVRAADADRQRMQMEDPRPKDATQASDRSVFAPFERLRAASIGAGN